MVPINFNYDNKQEGTDSALLLKKLLGILQYKSVDNVYQLYSKNSRFSSNSMPSAPPDKLTVV